MCREAAILPVTSNHYHNVLVLGDGTYSKEYAKTVFLISAHVYPNGTHVIVVDVYQNITERKATKVAKAIMDVIKKSLALNNLIVDCDQSKSRVFMYKSHRSIKSKLQLMVKNCINTCYKCLQHHGQHYKNYAQTMANCPSANIVDVCRKADNSPEVFG